jgi:hypothetical protein
MSSCHAIFDGALAWSVNAHPYAKRLRSARLHR